MVTVGQKLWYVQSQRPFAAKEITVGKVGRKYFTTTDTWDRLRIDVETLYADGGQYTSPGKCYASREDFERIQATQKAWMEFKRDVDKGWSFEGTIEQIIAAREALGLPSTNDKETK